VIDDFVMIDRLCYRGISYSRSQSPDPEWKVFLPRKNAYCGAATIEMPSRSYNSSTWENEFTARTSDHVRTRESGVRAIKRPTWVRMQLAISRKH